MDKFKALKTFCNVVETQSFTKTAQNMSLSKAAISKHIRELEEQLNITLVKRNTRGVNITESGLVYYERVNDLLKKLISAEDEVRQYEEKTCGHIKISIPVSMGLLFITPLFPKFMDLYPDITIEVVLTDSNVDILNEKFDLTVRVTGKMFDSNIRSRKIGQFSHVICASQEYLKRHGSPLEPCDLTRHDVLVYTGASVPFKWRFIDKESSKDYIAQISGHYRSNNSLALKQAAMLNQGLLRIPSVYVKDELKSGALISVLNNYQIEATDIFILYSSSHVLPHRVRVLIDYLVENFNIE
jgi:DNA-binding transcriptional LysR family regulator